MNELTLALARIGDLLVRKTITKSQKGDPILDVDLIVPEYQRPYKWSAKNANQLLDDILEAQNCNKEVYRVGTLILHKDSKGAYNIVDGQQRTITFALLLKCLECGDIAFLRQELTDNYFNLHNVANNYRSLKRRIENLAPHEKAKLARYVEDNCEMIVVITDDISEAFQFFDSQNARGKKLYPHDLLKAYHLREMRDLEADATEKVVCTWENMNQKSLSALFSEYLYRVKEWVKGNRADELDEHNIELFKGVSAHDNYPYAQFYKGAFAYADNINNSALPFVTGIHKLNAFQLDTPIIAGKPFFDYAKHYFDILADIQDNDKYEGIFINDNEIVKTLNLRKYKNGVGNRITRLLLDTAILLYIDRFCPDQSSETDLKQLDQFVVYAFVWAYSLRAQYYNVGWLVAQNYIMGTSAKDVVNAFNIYKLIIDANSPIQLMSVLADRISVLPDKKIVPDAKKDLGEKDEDGIEQNYLHYFRVYHFLEDRP